MLLHYLHHNAVHTVVAPHTTQFEERQQYEPSCGMTIHTSTPAYKIITHIFEELMLPKFPMNLPLCCTE